jgi:hypothetical protein
LAAAGPTFFSGWSWQSIARRTAVVLAVVITLATFATHEAYVLQPKAPQWAHFRPFKWWLIPHVVGGMIALLLIPAQLSKSLRRGYPIVHRWLGRLYISGVAVSSLLSVYIVVRFELRANWWVMGAMGGLWFVTTLFGWLAALGRNHHQHALWMGRSIGLTMTFVATRIIPDQLLPGLDYTETTALYWAFIVASLIAPDLILNGAAVIPIARKPSRPAP